MTALHYATQNFYNYRKEPLNLIKKLLKCDASLEVKNKKGQTPLETAQEHSEDKRVSASDELIASLKHGNSPPTPSDLEQSVIQIFQMSQHMVEELHSSESREYRTCSEGTLYFPKDEKDVVEKLHGILQSARGNNGLLSAFESGLSTITNALEKGLKTGEVTGAQGECIPKRYDDAKLKLAEVMDALGEMKQEMATSSKDAEVESKYTESKSQSQYKDTCRQLREVNSPVGCMRSTESSKDSEEQPSAFVSKNQ